MQEHRVHNARHWPLIAVLTALFSAPLVVMYVYQVIDTVTTTPPGSIIPMA
jgi:inositol-phosphate transport system permease protein